MFGEHEQWSRWDGSDCKEGGSRDSVFMQRGGCDSVPFHVFLASVVGYLSNGCLLLAARL
jgi:hypothetical protein